MFLRLHIIKALGFAVFILSASISPAQSEAPISIPKLDKAINFDGKVDEAMWTNNAPFEMTTHWPDYGDPAFKQTEMRVAYDDTYFYVSAICYESPDNIQESTFRRDGNWNLQSDQIAIMLDTYNDNENGILFVISPSGARTDISIRNDFISGAFFSESWNSIWEAKIDFFDGGWQTEVRIPFNILRFESVNNLTEMGMILYRYSAHDKRMDTYPEVSNQFGFFSFAKPSLAQDVTFKDIQNKRPVFFTPFVLASNNLHHQLNELGDDYEEVIENDLSAGFGVQYALTNNLNADLSFNTDFAQVEADNQQVNLTRFSLFFPEKRKFFQERSSTFEFNNDGNNKLFYSRRIGLKEGNIVPLWGGARLVGRIGNADFGMLSMQSKDMDSQPSENYTVIRFRSDVLNENSYIGGMMTSVLAPNGSYNVGVGVDALLNPVGNEYFKINLATTLGDDIASDQALDQSRVYLEWEKRKNVGFGYRLNYGLVGNDYRPALGFENRFNYWQVGDRVFYNFWMKEDSPLQRIDIGLNSNVFFNRVSDDIETVSISPNLSISGKNEFSLDFSTNSFYDIPEDTFSLADEVYITPGEYWNHSVNLSYSTPQVRPFRMNYGYQYGGFYGGIIHAPSMSFNYLANKYLNVSSSVAYNHIKIPDFDAFETVIARLNLAVTLNVKWTITSFAQYNSAFDLWTINNRLRFNPRDGINLYLVYNGNYNVDTQNTEPRIPNVDASVFILKYSHTFIF